MQAVVRMVLVVVALVASSVQGWAGPILDSAQARIDSGQVRLVQAETQGIGTSPGRSKGKTIAWATVTTIGLLMVAAPGDTCDGSRDTGVVGLGAIVAGLGFTGLSLWSD